MLHLKKVVAMLQADFYDGRLVEYTMRQVVVLIYKGGGNLCVISLVDLVWMVATLIVNFPFIASIAFHNIPHGFRAGSGTGMDSLETKLVQQFMSMREDFLYAVYLGLQKAYGALDRDICLDILEGYVMGPQDCLILCEYWDRLWIVVITGGVGVLWGFIPRFLGG